MFNGERRSKRDAYFCALGAIDELNSHLGLARDFVSSAARDAKENRSSLDDVHNQLYLVLPFTQKISVVGNSHAVFPCAAF